VEEIFGDPQRSVEAASARVWSSLLDRLKEPELPLDVIQERMDALQQRLLRFVRGNSDPGADGTLIMVETSNLLDFLGLRHHPASSTLRSCVGDMSKGCQGLPAFTNAVKVVAGLRQFIEAIYADHPGATTIEEKLLMEALGAESADLGPWHGRCEDVLERRGTWLPESNLEEDETVQRARAWLSSRGLMEEVEELAQSPKMQDAKLQPPKSWSRTDAQRTPRPRVRRRPTSWAAEVRRQEAISDRLKAKAVAENMPLPCPEAVRRAQQRAKKIQLKQAEQEALELEQRLYHGQLVAAKTAELFRERDLRRVRSASRDKNSGHSFRPSDPEVPRFSPAPEPCPGKG